MNGVKSAVRILLFVAKLLPDILSLLTQAGINKLKSKNDE